MALHAASSHPVLLVSSGVWQALISLSWLLQSYPVCHFSGCCGTSKHPNQPAAVKMLALCSIGGARSQAVAQLGISTCKKTHGIMVILISNFLILFLFLECDVHVNTKQMLLVACRCWSTYKREDSADSNIKSNIVKTECSLPF